MTGEQLTEAALVRGLDDVLLDPPGCPICSVCAETEERFFSWFEIESFAEPGMHERLRGSVGFCPAHQRRVLRREQLSPVPSIVSGALAQLAPEAPARRPCPACERIGEARELALSRLAAALMRPELRARYEGRACGACLPHVAGMLASGTDESARLLARRLRYDLAAGDAFAPVAGRDDDAGVRSALRAALPTRLPADADTTGEAERAAWAVRSCPVCCAAGRAERRYLEWRRHEERADAADLHNEPGVLCAAHLHDLAADDQAAAGRAAARVRAHWLAELDRFLADRTGPPEPRRRRSARVPARVRRAPCPACEVRAGAEQRHLELVLRLLEGPAYARAYEAAHGLCLRHALAAGAAPAATLVRSELRARLCELDWEIAEAARKQRWDARHERPGPERSAYPRLSALIDGRTFLGGQAMAIDEIPT